MLTLYYKPSCPFCQRVLQMAENLNVEFDLKDISESEDTANELIEIGGQRMVPFLVDAENDVKMYESSDIIDYIRENKDSSQAASDAPAKPRVHVGGSVCESCEG